MNNGKIIWWTILIVMAVVIIWQFYWTDESETKCCTMDSSLIPNIPDTDSAYTFCKRNGKYYKSYTMGMTGKPVEDEITEQQFNSAWQNGKCEKK